MKPNIEIADTNRQEVANRLNTLLADEYIIYTKTRNAHWNVTGSNFIEMHKFFESQYESLDEIIDNVAERVRSIGHYSLGSLNEFLKMTRISENEAMDNSKAAIQSLLNDHETVICNIRKEITDISEKYKDLGTADFITGILEEHEKMAWMLRSHLD